MNVSAGIGTIVTPSYGTMNNQEVDFIGRKVSPYRSILGSYLKLYGAQDTAQRVKVTDNKISLSYICCEKVLSERSLHPLFAEKLIEQQYPGWMLEKTLDLVFSPKLTKQDWKEQLETLKEYNVTIYGLDLNIFDSVDVVDLSKISPNEVETLIQRTPQELIVVYGKCIRHTHLPISKGVTVIGSEATFLVKGGTFKLPIEKAIIAADKQKIIKSRNKWIIQKSPTEVNTEASKLRCGYYPVIYLNKSSIMGVTIDAADTCQGIVGSHGEINVCGNEILNTRECGVFLHDCDLVTATENTLKTKKANDKVGIITSSCKRAKFTENMIEYA